MEGDYTHNPEDWNNIASYTIKCILGCKELFTILGVTGTLTSGLIIVSKVYLRNFRVWVHIGVIECSVLFWGHCDLDLLLLSIRIMCGAYLLYYMS